MRVLITGAEGLLGSTIATTFGASHELLRAGRGLLDITDAQAVDRVVSDFRPDAIVNCVAYNDVDGAESQPMTALSTNAYGVLTLARAARAAGVTLVHYSSDFVFDGKTSRPYEESDEPNPISVYGASKLLGEWFAAEAPRHYVLRVASLFGPAAPRHGGRRGSLGTIVDGIRAGHAVPVFVDRTVSPTFTPDIAAATLGLVERAAPAGTYHCVNTGYASWRTIAAEAARIMGLDANLKELTLETAVLKAERPRYCALSPARLASLGIVMPTWQDALERFLRDSPAVA